MPLSAYSLLRGSVINVLPFQKIGDHYNIEVQAAGTSYRIALDVYSTEKSLPKDDPQGGGTVLEQDRLVMFYKDEQYTHPVLASLLQTAAGLTAAAQLPAALHLDYIRYTPALFPLDQMTIVPPKEEDNDGNDLNDDIDPWIQKALNNPQAEVFVFGDFFNNATSSRPDPRVYFHPNPLLGVHDVHMNQGDVGSDEKDNGIGQDGALFLRFTNAGAEDAWIAMFFRFENQSIDTDSNGNPV